jgi:hypothetical protein
MPSVKAHITYPRNIWGLRYMMATSKIRGRFEDNETFSRRHLNMIPTNKTLDQLIGAGTENVEQ